MNPRDTAGNAQEGEEEEEEEEDVWSTTSVNAVILQINTRMEGMVSCCVMYGQSTVGGSKYYDQSKFNSH